MQFEPLDTRIDRWAVVVGSQHDGLDDALLTSSPVKVLSNRVRAMCPPSHAIGCMSRLLESCGGSIFARFVMGEVIAFERLRQVNSSLRKATATKALNLPR